MTSYSTFVKHAEKVTKKVSKSRPVLGGICHSTDGSLVVTDSYRLYKLHDGYRTDEAFIQDPTTGNKIEGNYPDTSRIIPNIEDAYMSVELNVKELLDATKGMYAAHKAINNDKNQHLTLYFVTDDESFELRAGATASKFQATYKVGEAGKQIQPLNFQPQFLIDALALFKDAGEQTIMLRLFGHMKPFILDSRDVTALILPVRTI